MHAWPAHSHMPVAPLWASRCDRIQAARAFSPAPRPCLLPSLPPPLSSSDNLHQPPPPNVPQAIKLYYHVLEGVLASEERVALGLPPEVTRLEQGLGFLNPPVLASLAALLTSTKFHKGLMACCLEVVGAAYK